MAGEPSGRDKMVTRRGEDPRPLPSETSLRVIMRGLREIMSGDVHGQDKLDRIVRQIAGVMVAEVCSIYLKRQDGSLELFATEGLNPSAVHKTRLKRGEGLVGRCAELGVTVNEPEASSHPAFSYRPETGEEVYHSLLAVPIERSGQILGVLVVQNRTTKEYSDEDVEVLQSTAMVIAENLISGAVAGAGPAIEVSRSQPIVIEGERAVGWHRARACRAARAAHRRHPAHVGQSVGRNRAARYDALDKLVAQHRRHVRARASGAAGEHREVLEAYRMFAHDKGWHRRLREAVEGGLTAEAAVERVQNAMRTRMLRQHDAYWRERQRDLDDLSDRLLRVLAGRITSADEPSACRRTRFWLRARWALPNCSTTTARACAASSSRMARARATSPSSPRRSALPRSGRRAASSSASTRAMPPSSTRSSGEVHLRPSGEVIAAYSDKVRFRARKQKRYQTLRDRPAVTKDGVRISLMMNAGLLVDMPHLAECGADGVGLYRTELQFMLSDSFPRLDKQTQLYKSVISEAAGKPVVFRTLDIGGDKVLAYLRQPKEENPAMGWRAIRMALDRPEIFRVQVRAMLKAAAGQELRVMIPMVTAAAEMKLIRALVEKRSRFLKKHGYTPADQACSRCHAGGARRCFSNSTSSCREVDFVSVGSNDLMQFLFAADRTNAPRGEPLRRAGAGAAARPQERWSKAAKKHKVPLNVCGEMAGSPLEAMTLIGFGLRSLSMAPGVDRARSRR